MAPVRAALLPLALCLLLTAPAAAARPLDDAFGLGRAAVSDAHATGAAALDDAAGPATPAPVANRVPWSRDVALGVVFPTMENATVGLDRAPYALPFAICLSHERLCQDYRVLVGAPAERAPGAAPVLLARAAAWPARAPDASCASLGGACALPDDPYAAPAVARALAQDGLAFAYLFAEDAAAAHRAVHPNASFAPVWDDSVGMAARLADVGFDEASRFARNAEGLPERALVFADGADEALCADLPLACGAPPEEEVPRMANEEIAWWLGLAESAAGAIG